MDIEPYIIVCLFILLVRDQQFDAICDGMIVELLSVLTGRHLLSFCNRFWRSPLAK